MNLKHLGIVVRSWIAIVAAQIVAGMIVQIKTTFPAHAFEWLLASDLLVATVLSMVGVRASLTRWKLAATLAGIPLAIAVTNLIEGAVFLKLSHIPWPALFLETSLTYALTVPFWYLIFGTRQPGAEKSSFGQLKSDAKVWRFLASDLTYVALYLVAGTIVFPFVRNFYSTQALPHFGMMIGLQFLLRGPLFVLLCLLLLRTVHLPRWSGALAVGLAFTVLSGIAPLLIPNPYFPDHVRWAHMIEVTSSNFLFGIIVSLMWGDHAVPQRSAQVARIGA